MSKGLAFPKPAHCLEHRETGNLVLLKISKHYQRDAAQAGRLPVVPTHLMQQLHLEKLPADFHDILAWVEKTCIALRQYNVLLGHAKISTSAFSPRIVRGVTLTFSECFDIHTRASHKKYQVTFRPETEDARKLRTHLKEERMNETLVC